MSQSLKANIADGMLTLVMPDGFSEMTPSEISEAASGKKPDKNWAARSNARHIIYNIAWNRVPLFMNWVPIERVMQNTERQIAAKSPEYKKLSDVSKTIGGEKGSGIRYLYTAQNIHMTAEYIIVKVKHKFFAFICLGQTANFDAQYHLFENMLKTVEFH